MIFQPTAKIIKPINIFMPLFVAQSIKLLISFSIDDKETSSEAAVEEAKEMAQKNDSYGDALYFIEKDSSVIKSSYVHYNRDNDKFSFHKPIWEK